MSIRYRGSIRRAQTEVQKTVNRYNGIDESDVAKREYG
jgi:hypothetical protein